VKIMGGEITFESQHNIGSTFTFTVLLHPKVKPVVRESIALATVEKVECNQEQLVFKWRVRDRIRYVFDLQEEYLPINRGTRV